jgi:hypothetical protein
LGLRGRSDLEIAVSLTDTESQAAHDYWIADAFFAVMAFAMRIRGEMQ